MEQEVNHLVEEAQRVLRDSLEDQYQAMVDLLMRKVRELSVNLGNAGCRGWRAE